MSLRDERKLLEGRYSRQIRFAPIGQAGQTRLRKSKVLLIGCGGLGSFLSEMAVRAGVGSLRIVDRDRVDPSNLQRQVLFDETDAIEERPKAIAAERKLAAINGDCRMEAVCDTVSSRNIDSLVTGSDLVLDAVDNAETRYVVNDACIRLGVPMVYGAAVGAEGMVMPVLPGETPCLRCLFESDDESLPTPTCDERGVIAPVVGMVASLQFAEALKILTGHDDAIVRRLRRFDLWTGMWQEMDAAVFGPHASCVACGEAMQ